MNTQLKNYHVGREGDDTGGKVICMVETAERTYELTPDHSLKVRNHSPTGFNYGYGGSGPAQLALSVLCDYFGDDKRAQEWYQRFKQRFLAPIDQAESFTITSTQIDSFVKEDGNAE